MLHCPQRIQSNGGITIKLSNFCISTIVNGCSLKQFKTTGRAEFTEQLKWKTANRLYQELSAEVGMPVIVSDAAYNTEHLRLWGIIAKLVVEDSQTTVQLKRAERIRGYHGRQELILRSTGQHIKPMFIRPYAICHTPQFLLKAAGSLKQSTSPTATNRIPMLSNRT
jgi:hypothetical protein